jgi:TolB-like protein/tetratricopeptide (TPR) repeat protein
VLAAGTQIGPYTILSLLGAGGMGEVYRARDNRLGREVAIKVLLPQFVADAERLARFEREARVVAALTHPNIVVLHDYNSDPGSAYTVTELLEGTALRACIQDGPLPWRKVVQLGIAIAEGLAAAHTKGIIHRDLKPENLFLTADERVKILDFGLARVSTKEGPASGETQSFAPAHTQSGLVMGTIGYMSPEQIRGQELDHRSDIFSLGCVLYELACGKHPFQRETGAETQTAILREEPSGLELAKPPVPAELARVLLRCLEKHPRARFQSAADLAFALRGIASSSESTAVYAVVRPGKRRRFLWAGVASAVLGLVTLAAVVWWLTRPRPAGDGGQAGHSLESLAILPFQTDGDDKFLGDSVADEIINYLGQLKQRALKVKPWTSVAKYKGQTVDLKKAAIELRVQALVYGTVRQHGADLAISVALLDPQEDTNLWSKTFKGKKNDLLALQEQIGRELTENLRERVPGWEGSPEHKKPTTNPEAYLFYVRGRSETRKWTQSSVENGIALLDQALANDPTYALAYAAKVEALVAASYIYLVPRDGLKKARAAAEEAVKLDPQLAEAYLERGVVAYHEWDWTNADNDFKKALAINPGLAAAHDWYANYLITFGKSKEALAAAREAVQLEPDSAYFNADFAILTMFARRYDEAIALSKKTLLMDSRDVQARTNLGFTYALKGEYAEAIRQIELALKEDQSGWVVSTLGWVYAQAGRPQDARQMLAKMEEIEQDGRYVRGDHRAAIYLALKEKDEAFRWLQKAVEERSPGLLMIRADPTWDSVRDDPRFKKMVSGMGLEP